MPSFKRKRIPENPTSFRSMRRRVGRRGPSVKTLSYKVNKILSEQERKNFDTVTTLSPAVGTASIIQLNSIVQGDDATSRDGRKVAMVSSQMRYNIIPGAAGTSVPAYRMIVLRDMQSNGTTPVIGDILTTTSIRSPLTLDFKERFRVIHDNFSSAGKGDHDLASTSTTLSIPWQYFYKFKDGEAQTEYGGIGNIPTSNALICVFLAEAASTASCALYHRLRFTDS